MIAADFAIMHKTRPAHEQVGIIEVTGVCATRSRVVGDDVIDDRRHADRRREALQRARREGGLGVRHPRALLRRRARALAEAEIAGIVVTDTVPVDPTRKPDNMTVLTVRAASPRRS